MLFDVISTKDIPKPILHKNRLPKWQTAYFEYRLLDLGLVARLHDVGEDTCGGYTSTSTIAANHHWIIVVAFGGEQNNVV